jgi:hypothetical protein
VPVQPVPVPGQYCSSFHVMTSLEHADPEQSVKVSDLQTTVFGLKQVFVLSLQLVVTAQSPVTVEQRLPLAAVCVAHRPFALHVSVPLHHSPSSQLVPDGELLQLVVLLLVSHLRQGLLASTVPLLTQLPAIKQDPDVTVF